MKCIAVAATTMDGKIALDSQSGSSWTSEEDKEFLHKMLNECDAVVVGNHTYKAAQEPLSKRNCVVLTREVRAAIRSSDSLIYLNPARADMRRFLESYRKVAVLGGSQTYSYFLKHDMLDEVYLTVEPIVFGKGIPLFADIEHEPTHWKLASSKKLNEAGAMLLHYKIVR